MTEMSGSTESLHWWEREAVCKLTLICATQVHQLIMLKADWLLTLYPHSHCSWLKRLDTNFFTLRCDTFLLLSVKLHAQYHTVLLLNRCHLQLVPPVLWMKPMTSKTEHMLLIVTDVWYVKILMRVKMFYVLTKILDACGFFFYQF